MMNKHIMQYIWKICINKRLKDKELYDQECKTLRTMLFLRSSRNVSCWCAVWAYGPKMPGIVVITVLAS